MTHVSLLLILFCCVFAQVAPKALLKNATDPAGAAPIIKPTNTSDSDREHHNYVAALLAHRCLPGACCDKNGRYRSRGFQCDTPKNPCQMAGCTGYSSECSYMNRPDGSVCPGGNCYAGECIKGCVEPCCESTGKPVSDGTTCGSNKMCYSGLCVLSCSSGECCSEFGFAKSNGSPCTNGYCYEGECTQTRDKSETDSEPSYGKALKNLEQVTVSTRVDTPEEKWKKMQEQEKIREAKEALEEAEKEKALAKSQAEIDAANKKASMAQVDLARLESARAKNYTHNFTIALIVLAAVVAFLIIVAIIVYAVSRRRNNQEKEEFYEAN